MPLDDEEMPQSQQSQPQSSTNFHGALQQQQSQQLQQHQQQQNEASQQISQGEPLIQQSYMLQQMPPPVYPDFFLDSDEEQDINAALHNDTNEQQLYEELSSLNEIDPPSEMGGDEIVANDASMLVDNNDDEAANDEFLRPENESAAVASAPVELPDSVLDQKDMPGVLQYWDSNHTKTGFEPVPVLKRLSEIFEKELEEYMRKDPDPFDERHPHRADPNSPFGVLLKQLFRKDLFMEKLVNDYTRDNYFTRQNIQKNALELNVMACRLILTIMPGLETSAVFQSTFDSLVNRLYSWADDAIEPLQSYATGLLAAAMSVTEVTATFRESNTRTVPKMIKRLHMLQAVYKSNREKSPNNSMTSATAPSPSPLSGKRSATCDDQQSLLELFSPTTVHNSNALDVSANNSNMSLMQESSRDAFPIGGGGRYYKKMYIALHPHTEETSQMLILRYLTTMGEYQEFLASVLEHKALQLIFGYIENLDRRDTCLAFEALKYLASLLCHKKFALEFISHGGVERLLKVPRPSIAATGVSITMYYLAYCEDAMERICTMPKKILSDLVHYALWLLGRSYDSGKCHATMFFGLSFQFKDVLDEFDAQDGLRKLINVVSILKILNPPPNDEANNRNQPPNEDEECASRQLVRHVCVALKRYMESHLFYKYQSFMHQQFPNSSEYGRNIQRAAKLNMEQIGEQIRSLQENTSVRARWGPVDNLLNLGSIKLLFKIISLTYDAWNNVGRSETVRSALDVLSICCVVPRVYTAFCEELELSDNATTSGIYTILGVAAGDITPDPDVQKSALAVVCNCVCAPITRREPNPVMKCLSASKKNKISNKLSEDLLQKVWECVCSNNGIIVLLSLMQIKAPITDADCIRGMACRALAGLARSERVRQIIGKLPLFASGQIQTLMRDPILQEKRAEHVVFQKYALELLEHVTGKMKPLNSKIDPSLSNIHKANVIAQTKIQYNEQQLLQLIYDHLDSKGMSQTAQTLAKEAGLQLPLTMTKSFHQSPFDYSSAMLPTTSSSRNRLRSRMQEVNMALNNIANGIGNSTSATSSSSNAVVGGSLSHNNSFTGMDYGAEPHSIVSSTTPIKLIKRSEKLQSANSGNLHHHHLPSMSTLASSSTSLSSLPTTSSTSLQRSLQKQICSFPDEQDLNSPSLSSNNCGITLNTIVTEYLTNQHALCNHPMTTCPQFDLFTPHKCPDPKPNRVLGPNLNITSRLFRSQTGYNTAALDRHFVHTHFAPFRTIRSSDISETQFTCCAIAPLASRLATTTAPQLLITGTQQGEARAFNINDGTELFTTRCHNYMIDSIVCNRLGTMMMTSCSWRSPLSILWSITESDFVTKLTFPDDIYCEFANLSQDKVLGTQPDSSVIYDLTTGQKISTFTPTISNQYTKNRATFNPTDELILSDGVLWDVRSNKHIHKFDKLNQSLSGVFHPNGLEIISNTEVWDIRTFHLLQTVSMLDQCVIKFSPMKVLYGTSIDIENRPLFDENVSYDTSFRVLDYCDYKSIATVDVKRNVYDLSVNSNGSLIALVESQPAYDSKQETFVKMYAVGMRKNEEDEDEEEDQDMSEDGSDSDGEEALFEFNDGSDDDDDDDNVHDSDLSSSMGSDNDVDDNDDNDDDDDDDDDDDTDNENGNNDIDIVAFMLDEDAIPTASSSTGNPSARAAENDNNSGNGINDSNADDINDANGDIDGVGNILSNGHIDIDYDNDENWDINDDDVQIENNGANNVVKNGGIEIDNDDNIDNNSSTDDDDDEVFRNSRFRMA